MMKRLSATLLAFAILALGSGARLWAHEGREHKVMGTVTMAAAATPRDAVTRSR